MTSSSKTDNSKLKESSPAQEENSFFIFQENTPMGKSIWSNYVNIKNIIKYNF